MLAFVFVQTEVNAGSHVPSEVAKNNEVKEPYAITGGIDFIAKVSASDIDELSRIIRRIREVEGI